MDAMNTRLFALFGALLLAGAALGLAPAAGSTDTGNAPLEIGVTEDDGVIVTVTANGTAVAGATVAVDAIGENASYDDVGTYTTDANGTVALATPTETVDVSIAASADGRTAEKTATLRGADEGGENVSFGKQVSAFVHSLQESGNATGIGPAVSAFVTVNDPGNAPDHASGPGGPNASNDDTDRGPPAFVQALFETGDDGGNETDDDRRGPPAHAGEPDDENETGDDEADANANESDDVPGDGNGPPKHAGNNDAGDNDAGDNDTGDDGDTVGEDGVDGDDEDAEDDDVEDDDGARGNGQGPPDYAGPGNGDADEANEEDE